LNCFWDETVPKQAVSVDLLEFTQKVKLL